MPSQGHIQVRMYVDGQPAQEYAHPDGGSDTGHKVTRFVEVKAEQKFWIEVTILPEFDFFWAYLICIGVRFDHQRGSMCKTCTYHEVRANNKLTHTFSSRRLRNPTTGRWHISYPYFGALKVEEDAALPQGFYPPDLDLMGSVTVFVFRAEQQVQATPYTFDGNLERPLDQISENALKGRSIRITIKYAMQGFADPEPPRSFQYVQVNGPSGTPFQFRFLYRDRKALQSLGCILRTPSPPPDLKLMLHRTEDMLRLAKQQAKEYRIENMELREMLARAETGGRASNALNLDSESSTRAAGRGLGIPIEPLSGISNASGRDPVGDAKPGWSSVLSNIKEEGSSLDNQPNDTQGTKRTREEAILDDGNDLVAIAPPPRKARIVVDLTDD